MSNIKYLTLIVMFIVTSCTSSSGKTYTCDWDSKTYKGKGYTSVMRIVRQVDDENSPFNNYCSRSCANAFLRSTR